MAEENANQMLNLLHEWVEGTPTREETKSAGGETKSAGDFEETMKACHRLLTKESSSGVLLWDPVFLPWDGAVQVSDRLGQLLAKTKADMNATDIPKIRILNLTGRDLELADIPLLFPEDVDVVMVSEAMNRKFDVIITDTNATPEDTLLDFTKETLWPHGDLVCFGSLSQRIIRQLVNNKYALYRKVEDEETPLPFVILKKRDAYPVLFEMSKSCMNVITKCIKYFRKLNDPEATKIAVKWKVNLKTLKQGVQDWKATEFASASTLWRIKFLLWSVYDIVSTLMSFLQTPSSLVFKLVKKISKVLLKVFVSLFHLMLYGGLLLGSYTAMSVATVTVFSFTGLVGLFFSRYISDFRKLAMTLVRKTLSKNYFVFVKNLLKQYKENQIYFWVLIGAVIPVTFVSYIGSEFITDLVVDLGQAFRVMFLDVVNAAHALVKGNINLKYWVLEVIPITWLKQFFTTYIFTPFQRYILSPILESAYYQSVAGTLAFITWMGHQYKDIYIGPNRLYITNRPAFFYVDNTLNQLTVQKQVVGSTKFLHMINYFETEMLCRTVIKNLWSVKKDWTYFTSNKLKFLKGNSTYVFLDAVNMLLALVQKNVEDAKIQSIELTKIRGHQETFQTKLDNFQLLLNRSTLSQQSKEAVLQLLQQDLEQNQTSIKEYLYQDEQLLQEFESLQYNENYYADLASLQENLSHYEAISNALQTELIILGETIWFTGQATVRGTTMRQRYINNPVIEPNGKTNPKAPPLYFYQNKNGTFSPLFHLNVVVLSE